MTKISVVIPTYKDDERLNKCIAALNEQICPKDLFEVIVVNNDTDSDVNIKVDHSLNLTIYRETKPGSYAARNRGIKQAKGEILAFTDSDCIPDKNWLKNALNGFNNNPEISRIGGKIQLFFSNKKLNPAEIFEKVFAFKQQEHVDRNGAALTANMLSKRDVFDEVGFFNTNLFSGGDVEWGMCAQNAKFKILYYPHAIVWHPARSSLKELINKKKRIAGGMYKDERSSIYKLISSIILGFLPPVFKIKNLIKLKNLSWYEKVISVTVLYLLRIVKNFYMIGLIIGICRIEKD